MPDDTINIYAESSFTAATSGSEDAYVNFLTRVDDNIGRSSNPAELELITSISGQSSFTVEYQAIVSGTGDFTSTALAFELDTLSSGVLVALTEYSTPTNSGTPSYRNNYAEYFTGFSRTSGTQDPRVDATMGDDYLVSENMLHSYWTFAADNTTRNYLTLYTAGNDYDPTDPDDVVTSGTHDSDTYFTMGTLSGHTGTIIEYVDLTLAGYVFHFYPYDLSYNFDAVAGQEDVAGPHELEATVISGALDKINFDLYSSTVASGSLNSDAYCGLVDLVSYGAEAQTISGTISYHFSNIYCGTQHTQGFNFDVQLLSLKISNFSLAVGEYVNSTGTICVDITDDVYNVVTSGTHFIIDGTVTSGIFTPITHGYRMCYDPVDDFASILGSTTFTVHAQNDHGDTLERDFYLTSGYIVEYDNVGQDYGYGSQVVVRMTAENFASCPAAATYAYWFTTAGKRYYRQDLPATIIGRPLDQSDLAAILIPNTELVYFYGKTFRVEVQAKDFAGNEMTPYIFEFRIEDKPED